jgi:hypothetical protein
MFCVLLLMRMPRLCSGPHYLPISDPHYVPVRMMMAVVIETVPIFVSPIGFVSVVHYRVWEILSIPSLSIVNNLGMGSRNTDLRSTWYRIFQLLRRHHFIVNQIFFTILLFGNKNCHHLMVATLS